MGVMKMPNKMPGKGPMGGAPRASVGKNVSRILKTLAKSYPVLFPCTCLCIIFSSIVSAIPAVFIQKVIAAIEKWVASGDWGAAKTEILPMIAVLVTLYLLSILSITLYTQLMAYMTQGYLCKLRKNMFNKMQDLPLRFFDSTPHGDIMSYYTNDIDTLRELVSSALPTILQAGVVVLTVLGIMIYYSLWLTLLTLLGVVAMFFVTKKIGGGSTRYFTEMQRSTGAVEGFIQEAMNGQKVVKVFSHENRMVEGFDRINDELYENTAKGAAMANALGPIIMNIGNVLYVIVAVVGGLLIAFERAMPVGESLNVSISGLAFGVSIVVPFLNMTKQFTGNINQFSQQFTTIIRAVAGADRVFSLMDEAPETDEGYVTLVNAREENGEWVESEERTGHWAWRHPHSDGRLTYTPLRGDVRLTDVDFAYEPGKPVLHNVTLFAEPGQKVAFVGATGAGKTTITNLLNRFYDIEDGKIRYDGININKIKKADLRRSLGLVLQDTNLFTGTVLENIRYGRLDATDEECRAAAELAGADDFILRLPKGYETELTNNGANLSQGQRQLIAIARAAVADPPVMILDEATSSIDTRTEAIVQRGMDKLMEGRTVFVIAHRLSTVRNSDVIMVLDHGRIIERGNHEKLIAEKGTYYWLYTGAFELE